MNNLTSKQVRFLKKNIDKCEINPILSFVHVMDNYAYATDTFTISRVKTNLPNGVYNLNEEQQQSSLIKSLENTFNIDYNEVIEFDNVRELGNWLSSKITTHWDYNTFVSRIKHKRHYYNLDSITPLMAKNFTGTYKIKINNQGTIIIEVIDKKGYTFEKLIIGQNW